MKRTRYAKALKVLVGLGAVAAYGGYSLVFVACSSGDDDGAGGGSDATAADGASGSGGDGSAGGGGGADGGGGGSSGDGGAGGGGGGGGGGSGDGGPGGGTAPSCDPSDAAVRTDPYTFPANGQGACTSEQLSAFTTCNGDVDSGADASVAACAAVAAAGFAGCSACIYGTGLDVGVLSPLVVTTFTGGGHLALPNFGGCIAALDPTQSACAGVSSVSDFCEIDRCTGCTVSSADDFAEVSAFFGCVSRASATSCATQQTAENDCYDALADAGSPATPCLGLYDDAGNYSPTTFAMIAAVCGPKP